MRRGVGIGAIQKKKDAENKFKARGHELASEQISQLSSNLDQFRDLLESFACKHRNEIKKNPEFRRQFQEMCAAIGVDPLASSKGFWAEKLGVGEFYYELGVQIVEICIATNHLNGGLISLDELLQRLIRSRSKKRKDDISKDDILRAIEKLRILGSGFSVITLGSKVLVQSVPGELNMDHSRILDLAEKTGNVSIESVATNLNWEVDRAQRNLDDLVKDGLVWVDSQGPGGEVLYWFPTFFNQLK